MLVQFIWRLSIFISGISMRHDDINDDVFDCVAIWNSSFNLDWWSP